jgi:hypothetical protein
LSENWKERGGSCPLIVPNVDVQRGTQFLNTSNLV